MSIPLGQEMQDSTAAVKTSLPVFILGLGWAPVGLGCAITFMAIPQLLAAQNIAADRIAALTAFAVAPGFVAFLFGPLLDWRLKRKSYAIGFYLLGAVLLAAALLSTANLALLAALEFFAQLALTIGSVALGGWFSALVPKEKSGALGAWFTVWNIGMSGAAAMATVPLIRATSLGLGAGVIALWTAAPVLLLAVLGCKPADNRLARESIRAFSGDVAAILKSKLVLWTLLIFLSPVASFTMINLLGGLGNDFKTPEATVSLLLGTGGVIAGIFGSLAMPVIERWVAPRFLYLWVGLVGACFSLAIAFLPHNAGSFALAVLIENIGQAAGFSVAYAIMLRTIKADDPLAATQFALMNSAICLPLTYMQVFDGQGYALLGVKGAFLMDGAVSACAALALLAVFTIFKKVIPPG